MGLLGAFEGWGLPVNRSSLRQEFSLIRDLVWMVVAPSATVMFILQIVDVVKHTEWWRFLGLPLSLALWFWVVGGAWRRISWQRSTSRGMSPAEWWGSRRRSLVWLSPVVRAERGQYRAVC